jgi:hypothetical protein
MIDMAGGLRHCFIAKMLLLLSAGVMGTGRQADCKL